MGHSTLLIEFDQIAILVNPYMKDTVYVGNRVIRREVHSTNFNEF
jgi:L-ascorbate metabolism protein UlaG (beta-lactamase superfamily)